ncbi:MAG TPA: ABC transporter ATP-binding protein [Vicinamibacterales bacterium]
MRPLVWALKHTRKYRFQLALLAALSCAEVALRVLLPWPMKGIVDNALGDGVVPAWLAWIPGAGGGRTELLIEVVAAGFVIQLAHQGVLMLHTRRYSITGHELTRDLREELFAHLQALSLWHHSRTPVGDSVYRLESDTICLEKMLLGGVMPLVFSALTLLVMFGVLMRVNLTLALVSLSVVPFLFVWIRWSARFIRPGAERTRMLESRMSARLHESFAAIRLVKSFGREPYEGRRFSGAANEAMRARVGLSSRQAVFSSVVGALTVLGTSLVILAGGLLVLRGDLTVGDLLVALAYLGFVYGPLSGIANTSGTLQEAFASAGRVREVLALAPEVHEPPNAVAVPRLVGRVEFRNVSFAYDGQPILRDMSFRIEPGEFVAIVGPSGSGKTTMVSLLPRFYEAGSGDVLIDGVDVKRYRLATLRDQIGIVLQEAVVLSGSIRDNLRYGKLDATDAEIEAAARAANAHEFVAALPGGYDTELGYAGSGISGGQRQRLSMARAFLKDAPILVLDEPTAALDTVSERLVIDALRRLHAGRTTFVIAHRLSTVRNADRILVVESGRLVAQGTHETLIEESSLYRSLAAQFSSASYAPQGT